MPICLIVSCINKTLIKINILLQQSTINNNAMTHAMVYGTGCAVMFTALHKTSASSWAVKIADLANIKENHNNSAQTVNRPLCAEDVG